MLYNLCMYFFTQLTKPQYIQNMKDRIFHFLSDMPDTGGQLSTQILEDLEEKSKPSNNHQLHVNCYNTIFQ